MNRNAVTRTQTHTQRAEWSEAESGSGANKWHCLACLAWKRGGMWGSDMLLRAFSGLIIARATKFAAGGQSKSTFGLPSEYPGEVTTDASRQAACAYRSNRWINLTLHFSIEPVHTAGQAWRRHSAEHGAASWWPHQTSGPFFRGIGDRTDQGEACGYPCTQTIT